jgi:hypothetical protein
MHPLTQIPRKNWPVQVDELAKVVGDEAAMALFIRFNGQHLSIPKVCPGPGHVIIETIGTEKAALLCKEYERGTIIFPRGAYLLRKIRNGNIKKDYKSGMKQGDIASKYQLTTRQIITILNPK